MDMINKKELIHSGWHADCYKQGDFFIKEFHCEEEYAKKEFNISSIFYSQCKLCPEPITFKIINNHPCAIYKYIEMRELSVSDFPPFYSQMLMIKKHINTIKYDDNYYWSNVRLPQIIKAFEYLNEQRVHLYIDFLNNSEACEFCHGDFSFGNFGLNKNGDLLIFDFQHSGYAPKGWDISYLFSYLDPNKYTKKIGNNKDICKMSEIIAALRIARYYMKSDYSLLGKYKRIYEIWKTYNDTISPNENY